MLNALKHTFNVAACLAGSTVSVISGMALGVKAASILRPDIIRPGIDITISNPEALFFAGLTMAGSALFTAGYSRWGSKPEKTTPPPSALLSLPTKNELKEMFHAAAAYFGGAATGLSSLMLTASTLPHSGISNEWVAGWAGIGMMGATLFGLGYSRTPTISQPATPTVVQPPPQP